MKTKKLKFNKRKPKPISPEAGRAVFGALMKMLLIFSDLNRGRVNISALLSDEAKEIAYEAGFPGFVVQLPHPKPAFPKGGFVPEHDREYVIMCGRQMGRRALIDKILSGDQPIRIEPSCKELISELQAFGQNTKSDHVFDNETILEKRLREIRAKQAEADSLPAD